MMDSIVTAPIKTFKLSLKYGSIAVRLNEMAPLKIKYPKFLKDIPLWRRRQLKEDILWFSRFSPVERLEWADQEWKEIQDFIKKFGIKKHETGKRN